MLLQELLYIQQMLFHRQQVLHIMDTERKGQLDC